MIRHNGRGSKLSDFYPKASEWILVEQLIPLLEIFEEATNVLQKSDTPALHDTFILFDYLNEKLEAFVNSSSYLPAVRAAAKRAFAMIAKYEKLAMTSTLPRVAMIMHPAYKSNWFREKGWSQGDIDSAVDEARKAWQNVYRGKGTTTNATASPAADMSQPSTSKSNTGFAAYRSAGSRASGDAFEHYMNTDPDGSIENPLAYWSSRLPSDLARMGCDYASCPATSTDVERAFSGGRLTVSRMRHSLSSESTRAATVFGSWAKVDGLLPEAELAKALANKKSQEKQAVTNTDSTQIVNN